MFAEMNQKQREYSERKLEEARIELYQYKWPDGFVCRHCGNEKSMATPDPFAHRCSKCKRTESLTANTVFHNSRIPLHTLLYVLRMMCISEGRFSSSRYKDLVGISDQKVLYNFMSRAYKAIGPTSHRLDEGALATSFSFGDATIYAAVSSSVLDGGKIYFGQAYDTAKDAQSLFADQFVDAGAAGRGCNYIDADLLSSQKETGGHPKAELVKALLWWRSCIESWLELVRKEGNTVNMNGYLNFLAFLVNGNGYDELMVKLTKDYAPRTKPNSHEPVSN